MIDGQQRLTSTLIFLFELQRPLETHDSETEVEDIRDEYLVRGGRYKLTLMGDDRPFFKDYILEDLLNADNPSPGLAAATEEAKTPSQVRLLETKEYFRRKLEETATEKGSEFPSWGITLLEKIERMELMVYGVDNRFDAVRIFQTVNDRGKGLSDLEKTKSFFMHQLYLTISDENPDYLDEQIEKVQREFGKIYTDIEAINDTAAGESIGEDNVQRYHFILWNEEWTSGRDKRYYQNLLEHIKDYFSRDEPSASEIIEYTTELRDAFSALNHIVNRVGGRSSIESRLTNLFTAGRLGNFYPLLIAMWMKHLDGELTESELTMLLDRIETFVIRVYLIRQMPGHTGRTRMYRLARRFHKQQSVNDSEPADATHTADALAEYTHNYCDDAAVREELEDANVYRKYAGPNRLNELRYLLYAYEAHLEENLENWQFDLQEVVQNPDQEFSIEHVWPSDNSRLDLTAEEQAQYDDYVHRLGNLALMNFAWNAGEQNAPFSTKNSRYRKSNIRMLSADIAAAPEWGFTAIEEQEEKILTQILQRWPDHHTPESLLEA